MPIGPAQLASSLGALDGLEVDQGLEVTLPQVLGSAKTLLAADRAVLMLIDQTGALRWASGSDRVVKAVAGDLSMPIHVGSGPVGTLDVYVSAPRQWDDSERAALQAYAGLLASLLVAAATAPLPGRLTDQLREATAHRSLIQQAIQILVDREGLDAPAALGWLETAARSSGDALVQMARAVIAGGAAALRPTRPGQGTAARGHRPRGCRAPPGLGAARGRGPTVRAGRPAWPSTDRAAAGGRRAGPDPGRRGRTASRRPRTVDGRHRDKALHPGPVSRWAGRTGRWPGSGRRPRRSPAGGRPRGSRRWPGPGRGGAGAYMGVAGRGVHRLWVDEVSRDGQPRGRGIGHPTLPVCSLGG
jgi:hypothetical protein